METETENEAKGSPKTEDVALEKDDCQQWVTAMEDFWK